MSALDEIEARLQAATPGPWEADFREVSQHYSRPQPWLTVIGLDGSDSWGGCDHTVHLSGADAELIAHAPTDLAALVAVVKAVRSVMDEKYPTDREHSDTAFLDFEQERLDRIDAALNTLEES